jgi:hypothetical protein
MTETWNFESFKNVGAHLNEVIGEPEIINSGTECYAQFDGNDDALLVKANPLKNANAFTIEVIFKPDYSTDPKNIEQRFIHIQNMLNENSRILIELRLTSDGQWFLDTFIKSDDFHLALYAEQFPHPCGQWYHAALVYENGTMKHFVNKVEELTGTVNFIPIVEAHTSIGARINHISWYKGGIKIIKFSHQALIPKDFLPL